ncbi:AT-hook motif nuclear-localized protein 5 [Sesamum angolense]|uniref:AT-hook motif nuclear-localized protein n=1 Tax=Sesamum angolense TaxID=2727404 RepID=A0AAE1W9M6_9LAMI|nr:AT-hook motif nuclear-localized protein 5 [Sesamum angolense]
MDGREGMTLPGSASYYLNRGGIGGSGSGPGLNVHGPGGGSAAAQAGGMHNSTVFKTLTNPNMPVQPNVGVSGSSLSGPSFHVENPSPNFPPGMSMAMVSSGSPAGEPVKKKRGRPRKYGPDGANMSLGLSPMSKPSSAVVSPGERARRGRPPGTGWKQQLAPLADSSLLALLMLSLCFSFPCYFNQKDFSLRKIAFPMFLKGFYRSGEWMNSSAGLAFTPHVLHVGAGEDVAAKILAFAQQRPRALCIMSANGTVSAVTLRQPTSGSTVTYEGRFEILCLSGSYLVAESGAPNNRTGGISISVCSPDGHIIGGAIGGRLIAANPVQAAKVCCPPSFGGCSIDRSISCRWLLTALARINLTGLAIIVSAGGMQFLYGSTKVKNKPESGTKDEKHPLDQSAEKSLTPAAAAPSQSYTPNSGTSVWPPVARSEVKHSQTDIDLMRG